MSRIGLIEIVIGLRCLIDFPRPLAALLTPVLVVTSLLWRGFLTCVYSSVVLSILINILCIPNMKAGRPAIGPNNSGYYFDLVFTYLALAGFLLD